MEPLKAWIVSLGPIASNHLASPQTIIGNFSHAASGRSSDKGSGGEVTGFNSSPLQATIIEHEEEASSNRWR